MPNLKYFLTGLPKLAPQTSIVNVNKNTLPTCETLRHWDET